MLVITLCSIVLYGYYSVLAVEELTAATFASKVFGSTHSDSLNPSPVWLVEFYSSMCFSCKEFTPIWDAVAKSLSPYLSTGKINIDDKANMQFVQTLGVLDIGIPHLVLYTQQGLSNGVNIPIGNACIWNILE